MLNAHKIFIPRTAHYYTLGTPTEQTRYFWIACHGYGQMAQNFIHKFSDLDLEEHFVLAPDALSRFYWKGVTGQVGSSWMTKADRLDEIADYANYLSTLYRQYRELLPSDVKVILFGFSQGVATCFRWAMRDFPDFHHLVLWAGFVPEDLEYSPHLDYFSTKKLHFVYGLSDEFLTASRLEWHEKMVSEKGLTLNVSSFEGPHKVDRIVLKQLITEITSPS